MRTWIPSEEAVSKGQWTELDTRVKSLEYGKKPALKSETWWVALLAVFVSSAVGLGILFLGLHLGVPAVKWGQFVGGAMAFLGTLVGFYVKLTNARQGVETSFLAVALVGGVIATASSIVSLTVPTDL